MRLLAGEYADDATVLEGLQALRTEIAEISAWLERAEQIEAQLPHRSRALRLNRRLALRIVAAHTAWLDEVEAELGAA